MSKPTKYNYQSALSDGELMIIGPFHGFPVTLTYHPDMLFSFKGDQDFPKRDLMSLSHVLHWYARYHPRLTAKQRQELRDYHPLQMLAIDRDGPVDLDKWLASIGDLISEHYLDNMGSKEPMTEAKLALKEERKAARLAKRLQIQTERKALAAEKRAIRDMVREAKKARKEVLRQRWLELRKKTKAYEAFLQQFVGWNAFRVQYSILSGESVKVRQEDIELNLNEDGSVSLGEYKLQPMLRRVKNIHLFHMLNQIKNYLEMTDLGTIVKGSPYNHKTVDYKVVFPFDGTYESAFKVLYTETEDGWTCLADLYADSM